MKVVIVGLGYVGVTALACISDEGHEVLGVDVNPSKVDAINSGRSPITEVGVPELIEAGVGSGRVSATTELASLEDVDLVIVCVGTPSLPNGSHNMGYIVESTRQVAAAARRGLGRGVTVAYRSTFKPGTMDTLIAPVFREVLGPDADRVELVYNPEFLREASAVADFRNPPKIVIGTADGSRSAAMDELNRNIACEATYVRLREAEFTKFVDNTWHAVKVAFANEIGRIADAYGVSAATTHSIFVSDRKLNISPNYLRPGGPFGGSCLPKDVRALQSLAEDAGVEAGLVASLMPSNEEHKRYALERVRSQVATGGSVLVVGLAFKSGTDDLRESPALDLVVSLLREGYHVRVLDPAVRADQLIGQNLGFAFSALPELTSVLISESALAQESFDLVVYTNRKPFEDGPLAGTLAVDINSIP